ncbi:MAG: DNA (cytosine-5-)-methyltransferase [Aestuariivita sp.]|nr:DNA (cytosine-5-)-methyltransferase [Aestuariivita sp.]
MELKAVDLFCGSGGLSAGFINAGIKMLAAYDNWETALETYRRNLVNHAFNRDLSDIDKSTEEIESLCPDIIVGGPPCQDFSSAGKRVEGGSANLTNVFGKIVAKCKPSFFLMENVPQVRTSHAYQETKENLIAAGYTISETVLDASYCGVPQTRKRFFAFGSTWKDAPIKFLRSLESQISEKRMTIKEYLGDSINIEFYYRHPRNYSRRSVFSVYEPSPTIRGVNRPVPPGYKGNHLDRVPPLSVRPLTSFERSRIQTFPASWNWNAGDRNASAELQIGNAVPVNLASFVATGILNVTKTR